MPGPELGRDPLDLNEGDQLAIDAQPVVGELALSQPTGGSGSILDCGGPAALPLGKSSANAAWLVIATSTHNLLRWVAAIGLGGGRQPGTRARKHWVAGGHRR